MDIDILFFVIFKLRFDSDSQVVVFHFISQAQKKKHHDGSIQWPGQLKILKKIIFLTGRRSGVGYAT